MNNWISRSRVDWSVVTDSYWNIYISILLASSLLRSDVNYVKSVKSVIVKTF